MTKAEIDAHNARVAAQAGSLKKRLEEKRVELAREHKLIAGKLDPEYKCVVLPPTPETTLTCFSTPQIVTHTIFVDPMGAPRMTQRDRWKKRPIVLRYFAYRDRIRAVVGDVPVVPASMFMQFYMTPPESWSKKKKAASYGQLARSGYDIDNMIKGVLDTLFLNDSGVAFVQATKLWSEQPKIVITLHL